MSAGLLIDITQCVGCGACSAACKEQNDLPLSIEPQTTAYTWTTVEKRDGVNVRRLCMHCLEPTCVSVCPVGALTKTPEGPVVYDGERCIGCRYCIMACPFQVPKYQWDRAIPVVGKCVLCSDRLAAGKQTACASVCPTGATLFGERSELLREARDRIAGDGERYIDYVYGEEDAGGTSVLLLSGVAFDRIGLRTDLPRQSLPMLTWEVLGKLPDIVMLTGAFLFGIHWLTKRRTDVAALMAARAEETARAARSAPPSPAEPGPLQRTWRRLFHRRSAS